ncbi:MAG: rhamnogalacturonan acetylesterase [Candidatus Acidiferrales bacterium]|jgi:lysophospholipase L1-like esterase
MTNNSAVSTRFCALSRIAIIVLLVSAARASAQALPAAPAPATAPMSLNFSFGPQTAAPGATQVLATTVYSADHQFGFELGAQINCVDRSASASTQSNAPRGFCTSDKPFFFSVSVPEGDYDVTFVLGDPQGESLTTVKAESRRLLLEALQTASGEIATRTFTVSVRYPEIAGGGQVSLKQREVGTMNWDHKLTFEFSNKRPAIAAITITKAEHPITVYLAGDSTVVDQTDEPWTAWGQMLPRFFKPGVAISNQAESGETLKAFIGERRLAKILSTMKPGDYLFIQFTHNDQKPGPDHVDAATDYKSYLRLYINEARLRGATPVLVTSMNRRSFGPDGKIVNTMGDYPDAMRQLARDENVPLIDLNAMSKVFYEAMGPDNSTKAFVHYPAGTFPGQIAELKDDTHFNSYGAYELAKCIVEGIKADQLGIAKFLIGDTPPFDPAHPDPVALWNLPPTPFSTPAAPAGK